MSIVALKRKSKRFQNKVSSGNGFSKIHTGTSGTRLNKITKRYGHDSICPCNKINWVKGNNEGEWTQSSHINKLTTRAYSWGGTSVNIGVCVNTCNESTHRIGTARRLIGGIHKTVSGTMGSGEYTTTRLLQKNCLPTIPSKKPYPMMLNNTCNIASDYTPEMAINNGLLPSDWSGRDSSQSSNPICN